MDGTSKIELNPQSPAVDSRRPNQCFGWFRKALPPEFFDSLKRDLEIVENSRIFSMPVTVWMMIMQRLSPAGTLAAVVGEVNQGAVRELLESCKRVREERISANTGAYSEARRGLPVAAAWRIAGCTFAYLHGIARQDELRSRLFVLDGSSIRLAHSKANVERYPVARNGRGDSHWPVVRIGVMHHVITGLAMRPEFGPMYGPKAVSEQALAEPLIERLQPGSIIVADRNFGVFSVAWCAHSHGNPAVVRMTEERARPLAGGELSVGSEYRVSWTPSRHDRRAHPGLPAEARIKGRLIVAQGKAEILYLFTTLEEPAGIVAELYAERWNIETDLKSLKNEVRLHTIEARSPDMVAKELYLAVAAYNLIRTVMAEAATQAGIESRRLSFSRSSVALWAFVRAAANADSEERFEHHWQLLMRAIRQAKLPNRSGRSFPRAVWPTPQPFPTKKAH